MSDLKPGWYFVCHDCGIKVFVSKWKWWAKVIEYLAADASPEGCPKGLKDVRLEKL